MQDGLDGARRFIAGEIDREELMKVDYDSEGECFRIDYADKINGGLDWLQQFIAGISELDGVAFENARARVKHAAYFASFSSIYPLMINYSWDKESRAPFLDARALRDHVAYPMTPPSDAPLQKRVLIETSLSRSSFRSGREGKP